MINSIYPTLLALVFCVSSVLAQDTFSIVAVDEETGEVGSAGASCISADNLQVFFPGADPDFLGELIPGLGAINTQSFYLPQNQQAARNRLLAGDTPQQLVDWLAVNDAQGNSTQRQYGVAALVDGAAQAAAFTGVNCLDAKGHRVGSNYSIQGNILLSEDILDNMETAFLTTEGCLAEKIMAAMQAANVAGADSRCLSNGTSSMFAFLKVARADDSPTDPAVRVFVALNLGEGEPIDSLQTLFDQIQPCLPTSVRQAPQTLDFTVAPNPASGNIRLHFPENYGLLQVEVYDAQGRLLKTLNAAGPGSEISLNHQGVVFIRLLDQNGRIGYKTAVLN